MIVASRAFKKQSELRDDKEKEKARKVDPVRRAPKNKLMPVDHVFAVLFTACSEPPGSM